jgi:hypothetical protein
MPIEEDEHGTYIMNSKDLRAIEHVQRLVEIGVDSLKIEGRTKSPYYVARTAQVYRRRSTTPSPAAPSTPPARRTRRPRQSRLHRRLLPAPPRTRAQNYLRGHSESGRSLYVGDVIGWDAARGMAEVEVKNRFAVGDRIEIIHPSGNREMALERMENATAALRSERRARATAIACGFRCRRIAGCDAGALCLRPTDARTLFVDISSHGLGHLAQVAPMVNALTGRCPSCA